MILLLARLASAQEEACHGALPVEVWQEALEAIDGALADQRVAQADRVLDDVVDQLRCLEAVVAPTDLGHLARQVALVAFYNADEEERISWSWLARDTLGGTPWPDTLPAPERFHALEAELPDRPLTLLEGQELAPPSKGAVVLDGWPLAVPEARSGVVHLVQAVDRRGEVVSGWLQLGADFEPTWLAEGDARLEPPARLEVPPPPPPWTAPAVPVPAAPVEAPDDAEAIDPGEAPTASAPPKAAPPPVPVATDLPFGEVFPDCPWRAAPARARIEGREVVVNRQRHPVGRPDDVLATQKVFRSCGEFRAARRLGRWADERRKLFRSGADHRDAMIRVLLADEPRRSTSGKGRSTKD